MGRRPRDLTAEEQEQAFALVDEAFAKFKHDGLFRELGVGHRTVDRWRRREGISQRNAIALAKLLGKTLRGSGLHTSPDGRAVADELPHSLQGTSLAIRLLQAREDAGILFPNLAAVIRFDDGRSPSARRAWSKAAIVAAAGGAMGDEDLSTDEWVEALDAIDEALSSARKRVERPPLAPKRLRP